MNTTYPQHALAAVTHADPYPYYDELASLQGLRFDAGLGLWIAASAADVMAVMRHPDCRVRPLAEPVPAAIAGGAAGQVFGALVRMNDGERHAVPKLALQRALAGVSVQAAQQRAALIARRLWRDDGLASWMFEVPVSAMASLLGFADHQLPAVAAWMGEFVACLSPYSDASQIGRAHAAALALLDSFKELLRDAASSAAADSLLSQVIAEAQAVGWSESHGLLANLVGLLSQTYEATAGLIGNSVLALARQPEEERSGGRDAAALVQAVSRFDPPIQNTRRFVANDCEIGGVPVLAGQTILLVLAAANRDPRGMGREFGFGHGVHACPGQALACAFATGAMAALMAELAGQSESDLLRTLSWTYRRSPNARLPVFS
ncbi:MULTISPECIES: cytochrome P450 [unclassified Duganella]|uniref:cytochrome P450 n=1 Tax=unclassified Duganella TaxID=2636909 RepID=UPI000E345667|nr:MULTISPECIES: cytochrome P450 [unclassified Duganella]RFP10812.1 cytochrome P450 [Duganella sp. BJB475]RFP27160.1 cytochrome P450 [Duganella sp. BJB476]